jgi:type IV pilus assembly protein PilC
MAVTTKKKEFINYKWTGINRKGKKVGGFMCARSIEIVRSELRKLNV